MAKIWNEAAIREYISNEVQESISLDYKAADSLGPGDGKKSEITKDVSAMANSSGGLIIYGVKEYKDPAKRHLPEDIDPIDRMAYSKEWLDQIISNIRPRIDGVIIYPVPIGFGGNNVVYVIDIPQSSTAHQANDKRYYKRHNFMSIAMEDYEIRDVMGRSQYPKIELDFSVDIEIKRKRRSIDFDMLPSPEQRVSTYTERSLVVLAKNVGKIYAQYVNVFLKIPYELMRYEEIEEGYYPENVWNDNGRLYYEYSKQNTIRDIVDTEFNLAGPIDKYGPARYVPILPGLFHEWRITILNSVELMDLQDLEIRWEVYAD